MTYNDFFEFLVEVLDKPDLSEDDNFISLFPKRKWYQHKDIDWGTTTLDFILSDIDECVMSNDDLDLSHVDIDNMTVSDFCALIEMLYLIDPESFMHLSKGAAYFKKQEKSLVSKFFGSIFYLMTIMIFVLIIGYIMIPH